MAPFPLIIGRKSSLRSEMIQMLKRIGHVWPAVIAAILLVLLAACAAPGEPAGKLAAAKATNPNQRVALVIGNSRYAESPLVNPVNDARAMAATLAALGFTVTSLYDASLVEMNDAARQFGDKLREGGVGLFFYAGHGMQIRGRNFLIPVGADIKREEDVQYKSFDANQLLDKMESAKNPINIVILDACRNNPFARSFRSSATGLAQMDAPAGTYVSFSTAPGKVASDGEGANGLFTQHLLGALRTPGQKVEDVFKQVRVRVMQDSGGQQVPWDSSSLTGDFYFLRSDQTAPPIAAIDTSRALASASTGSGVPSTSSSPTPATPPAAVGKTAVVAPTAPAGTSNPPGTASTSRQGARAGTAAASSGGSDDAYRRGIDAQKKGNLAAAHDAFAAAAEQGSNAAQYELAMMLKAGRSPVRQDMTQARRWFARAADSGHVAAQFELGQLYEQGQGGEKSCKDAEKWLRRAAEHAHTEAMLQLGWMNLRGCGGEKNPAEAAKWLKQAAAKGSRDAQFSLGVLYFNGDGVAKDSKEARKLLEAAAKKGHPSAKFYLDRLN